MIADFFIRFIADWLVIPIVLIGGISMMLVPAKHRYRLWAKGLIAGMSALLLAKIASLLYQGERPFVAMGTEAKAAYLNNPGFPSDHVLFVFTITFVVWASTKNKSLAVTLFIMSVFVAAGRVVALVHTPIDVAGGVICALLAAMLVYGRNLKR